MTVAQWLYRIAQAHPELPAVALGPSAARRYDELARNVATLAGWLRRSGARRVRPVAIVSENRVEVIETLFACWWAGYPAAPIDPSLSADDLAAALAHCEAEACFVSPRAASAVMAAAGPHLQHLIEFDSAGYRRVLCADPLSAPLAASEKDLAWLSFCDFEPGEPPRAAMLAHSALKSLVLSILGEVDNVKPRDAQIHAMPWTGPAGFTILPTLARGGLNVMPETGAFDAAEFFENVDRWRKASTLVSDWGLRQLLASEAPMNERHFRTVAVEGIGVSRPLIEEGLSRFGSRIARIYGPEAFPLGVTRLNCHDVSARSEEFWQERVRSIGRPYLATEVDIRGEDDRRPLQSGEVGRLFARGRHGMRGYWRDRRSRAGHGEGAWRPLGVLGAVDRHGYMSVLGAQEDLLKDEERGLIAPQEIESALIDQGAAEDAGATSRPAPNGARGGDEIVVFLARSARGPAPSLLDPTAGAPARVARVYEVEALPRCPHGRMRRGALKRWALDRARAEAAQGAGAPA